MGEGGRCERFRLRSIAYVSCPFCVVLNIFEANQSLDTVPPLHYPLAPPKPGPRSETLVTPALNVVLL